MSISVSIVYQDWLLLDTVFHVWHLFIYISVFNFIFFVSIFRGKNFLSLKKLFFFVINGYSFTQFIKIHKIINWRKYICHFIKMCNNKKLLPKTIKTSKTNLNSTSENFFSWKYKILIKTCFVRQFNLFWKVSYMHKENIWATG